jgi:hypothetical protein
MRVNKKKECADTGFNEKMAKKFDILAGPSTAERLKCYISPSVQPDHSAQYGQLVEKYEELEHKIYELLPQKDKQTYQELLDTIIDISAIEQVFSYHKGLKAGYSLASCFCKIKK